MKKSLLFLLACSSVILKGISDDDQTRGLLPGLPALIPLPSLNYTPTPAPQPLKKAAAKESVPAENPASEDTTEPLNLWCLKNLDILPYIFPYLDRQAQGNLALACQGTRGAVQATQGRYAPLALRIPLSGSTTNMLRKRPQEWGPYTHITSITLVLPEGSSIIIPRHFIKFIKKYFPNLKKLVLSRGLDEQGGTLLHCVTHAGYLEEVQELIAQSINISETVNLQTSLGNTPLHLAAVNGQVEVVAELIKHDAAVNTQNSLGYTPLHYASRSGHLNVAIELIAHDANVNAQNNKKETPLHLAAANGHSEIVTKLITYGADVNAQDENSQTPLHLAVKEGHLATVIKLTERGSVVNTHNNYRLTLLRLAELPSCTYEVSTYLESFAHECKDDDEN